MGDGVTAAELAASELFTSLPGPVLEECAVRARSLRVARGTVLARQGEPADAFYLLLDGSVEVVLERVGEPEEFIRLLGRGDCFGELALLLGEERTATVRALRDCRVVRMTVEDFAWLLRTSPDFTVQLARAIGGRLQRTTRHRTQVRPVERVAAVAASGDVDLAGFSRMLEAGLAGEVRRARRQTSCELVVVDGTLESTADVIHALRDADVVLLIGHAMDLRSERLQQLLTLVADLRPQPRLDLVLLHRSAPPYHGTLRWVADRRLGSWHHVQSGRQEDVERLARRLIGHAVGLVLSGGGARGFAHIGVLRAFDEAGIPIDFVAGSSMGAIIAAHHATGADTAAIIASMHKSYVRPRRVPDLAIPYVAIRTGAASDSHLRRMFGDTRIEDLQIPFFCVSSSLITAETVVHERGRLWRAVRSSCSVPGLVPPVRFRGDLLVDGGLLDNLPVGAMRERCSGRIVASDVSVALDLQMQAATGRRRRRFSPFAPPAQMPGIGPILMRTVQLASVRDSRESGIPADLYLRPAVDDVGMNDFARIEESVERGHEHALEELTRWRK